MEALYDDLSMGEQPGASNANLFYLTNKVQEVSTLTRERAALLRNISCLYNTAKEEVSRKQTSILELRQQLSSQPPRPTANTPTPGALPQPAQQQTAYPARPVSPTPSGKALPPPPHIQALPPPTSRARQAAAQAPPVHSDGASLTRAGRFSTPVGAAQQRPAPSTPSHGRFGGASGPDQEAPEHDDRPKRQRSDSELCGEHSSHARQEGDTHSSHARQEGDTHSSHARQEGDTHSSHARQERSQGDPERAQVEQSACGAALGPVGGRPWLDPGSQRQHGHDSQVPRQSDQADTRREGREGRQPQQQQQQQHHHQQERQHRPEQHPHQEQQQSLRYGVEQEQQGQPPRQHREHQYDQQQPRYEQRQQQQQQRSR
ncbi:MAG: hypothetical protein WDW38_001495 [Sanguina aurantia]